jgi:isopentenyl diphosphate isomerase/L-lactate dehydrogenase-like FMN-dependent dehydrogenase
VVEVAQQRGKEAYLDSGVRRGTDVVKALSVGARACLVARPYHWALAAAGEDGVVRMLELYRAEIDNVLAQLGRPTVAELDRSCVDHRLGTGARATEVADV